MQESFEVTSRKPHCLGTRLVHWLGRTVSETEADPQQVSIIVFPLPSRAPSPTFTHRRSSPTISPTVAHDFSHRRPRFLPPPPTLPPTVAHAFPHRRPRFPSHRPPCRLEISLTADLPSLAPLSTSPSLPCLSRSPSSPHAWQVLLRLWSRVLGAQLGQRVQAGSKERNAAGGGAGERGEAGQGSGGGWAGERGRLGRGVGEAGQGSGGGGAGERGRRGKGAGEAGQGSGGGGAGERGRRGRGAGEAGQGSGGGGAGERGRRGVEREGAGILLSPVPPLYLAALLPLTLLPYSVPSFPQSSSSPSLFLPSSISPTLSASLPSFPSLSPVLPPSLPSVRPSYHSHISFILPRSRPLPLSISRSPTLFLTPTLRVSFTLLPSPLYPVTLFPPSFVPLFLPLSPFAFSHPPFLSSPCPLIPMSSHPHVLSSPCPLIRPFSHPPGILPSSLSSSLPPTQYRPLLLPLPFFIYFSPPNPLPQFLSPLSPPFPPTLHITPLSSLPPCLPSSCSPCMDGSLPSCLSIVVVSYPTPLLPTLTHQSSWFVFVQVWYTSCCVVFAVSYVIY
ncbi:unnamed protein product [Closterium sp. Yama58-4]|nr:unnamed protein product [Closterium sp. Yama58-4]